MEEKQNPQRTIQVVLRPSSPVLKVVVIVLIVFSTVALIALGWVRSSIRAETDKMREEAAAVQQDNEDLEQKKSELGSVQSIQDIAREELGMVDPDTVIITPSE